MKRFNLIFLLLLSLVFSTYSQPQNNQTVKSNWLVGDFFRSSTGAVLGGFVIGGTIGFLFQPQRNAEYFVGPDAAALSIGMAIGSALGASWFLYHSHNREGSFGSNFLKTAWLPLLVTLPASIKAANKHDDHSNQVASVFGVASVAISAIWAIYVYRRLPLRSRKKIVFFPGTIRMKYIPGDFRRNMKKRIPLLTIVKFNFGY